MLKTLQRKTDCNDTMQTDIWPTGLSSHFSVRWQKCISGAAGGISACESSLRARLISSPCFDPHRQRNQSHSDSHYQIGFEAFFFFQFNKWIICHSVKTEPFMSAAAPLNGFRHGCSSSMTVFQRNILNGWMSKKKKNRSGTDAITAWNG